MQAATFEALDVSIMTAPVLQFPSWDRLFFLETNASGVGLGAALTQDHGAKMRLLVVYTSRTLHNLERRYSAMERERLADLWVVQ